jgi:hypothetical protein
MTEPSFARRRSLGRCFRLALQPYAEIRATATMRLSPIPFANGNRAFSIVGRGHLEILQNTHGDQVDRTWNPMTRTPRGVAARALKIRTANVDPARATAGYLGDLDCAARESHSSSAQCASTWPCEEILGGAIVGTGMHKYVKISSIASSQPHFPPTWISSSRTQVPSNACRPRH